MAKFTYSMQSILDVKYKLEDQAKTAFMQAQVKVDEAQNELVMIRERKVQYEQQKKTLLMERLDVKRLNECENAIQTMDYYIDNQQKKVAALEAVLDNARRKLKDAMVDCKMHEKLKENEFQDFIHELNEQEKKEIDELVSYQYNKPREQ